MPVHTLVLRNQDDRVTELNGQRIVFPDIKRFEDLFPTHKPQTDLTPGRKLKMLVNLSAKNKKGERLTVSESMMIDRHNGLEFLKVTIHPFVRDWIKKGVLRLADQMCWRITVWPNDDRREALVILSHGQIIGSHYVAIIDAGSVPTFKEAEDVSVTAS